MTNDSGTTAQATTTSTPKRNGKFIRDLVIILLVALVIAFFVKTFLVRSFYIPSGSMENTLQIDDRVIVDELVPKVIPLKHGDVVVFTDPGGWLTASEGSGSDHLIKRVIGLPGDTVACCNAAGDMMVNGVPLKEPYTSLGYEKDASGITFDVTVPANSLWVMGDNRYDSEDSRYHQNDPTHGFVPMSDVTGRAVLISWPISRWTWLGDYPNVFAGVERKK